MMLVLFLLLLGIYCLSLGVVNLSLSDLYALSFSSDGDSKGISIIVFELRLPRILMSILVGGSLAVSGAVMQGVFRNPLADPGLIGVSAGSALGASIAMVLGVYFFVEGAPLWLVPFTSFFMGLLVMSLVYLIAKQDSQAQVATLLLSGVALSALCTALSALLIYVANDQQLRGLSFWQLGSFGGSAWRDFFLCAFLILPALLVLLSFAFCCTYVRHFI